MEKWRCCASVFAKTFCTSINARKAKEQHPCPFLILRFHVYIYSVYLKKQQGTTLITSLQHSAGSLNKTSVHGNVCLLNNYRVIF